MKTEKQIIGKLGEDLVCRFLIGKGYKIIERNYLKKWGEIDIVAKSEDVIHFVEVKTVRKECYTNNIDRYRAEDNMHLYKSQRLRRAIQSYILERRVGNRTEWKFDLVTVLLDKNDNSLLHVEHLEDLVI